MERTKWVAVTSVTYKYLWNSEVCFTMVYHPHIMCIREKNIFVMYHMDLHILVNQHPNYHWAYTRSVSLWRSSKQILQGVHIGTHRCKEEMVFLAIYGDWRRSCGIDLGIAWRMDDPIEGNKRQWNKRRRGGNFAVWWSQWKRSGVEWTWARGGRAAWWGSKGSSWERWEGQGYRKGKNIKKMPHRKGR